MESLLVCGLEATLSVLGRTKPARLSRSRIIWPLMLTSRGELEWRLREESITAVRARREVLSPVSPNITPSFRGAPHQEWFASLPLPRGLPEGRTLQQDCKDRCNREREASKPAAIQHRVQGASQVEFPLR